MNKDEILEMSRRKHQNRDYAALDADVRAGNIAERVGACVCCLVSVTACRITGDTPFSPWIIYFSILGSHSRVKYLKWKRNADLALSALYFLIGLLAFAGFVLPLTGVRA